MRADRLLSLLLFLQTRGRVTATDLAARLEVSVRTIYRDLDALSAAGVPVYATRGAGGGCALQSGYKTDLTALNATEVASLFAGASSRALEAIGLAPGLESALLKLEAALPGARRRDAARVRARVYVDATAWFGGQEPTPHLAALRDAVFDDRLVRLTYQRADGGTSKRWVEPLGLVVKAGIWYLVASTTSGTRVYRVSRLRNAVIGKRTFERPARFDLAAFWTRSTQDFVARIPEYYVRVRVAATAVGLLPQVLGERVRAAIDAAQRPTAGQLVVDLTFDSIEAACGQLLALGTAVEALAPEELRTQLHRQARAIADQYG